MSFVLRRLGSSDLGAMRALNALFAEAFEDPGSYQAQPPSDDYLADRLARHDIIVLCAFEGETVIGGLVAYVLDKLEQARAEVYIYDLAVAEAHRRQGAATALIEALKPIAREAGAWVIYVQADYEDPPAIALYEKLGVREEVLHFDIAPGAP
ncbi:MAG: AAC(3)-I family aminoglycoside N-acetyltransferase [Alphaproteobacteria bacterium]|nr:AAC(3)-I family aminoglycoside N-acetyltransferase [Alphaproteobacteria bacterium]